MLEPSPIYCILSILDFFVDDEVVTGIKWLSRKGRGSWVNGWVKNALDWKKSKGFYIPRKPSHTSSWSLEATSGGCNYFTYLKQQCSPLWQNKMPRRIFDNNFVIPISKPGLFFYFFYFIIYSARKMRTYASICFCYGKTMSRLALKSYFAQIVE